MLPDEGDPVLLSLVGVDSLLESADLLLERLQLARPRRRIVPVCAAVARPRMNLPSRSVRRTANLAALPNKGREGVDVGCRWHRVNYGAVAAASP
eukprot:750843-Pleurochrysis_carterae.AAC.1